MQKHSESNSFQKNKWLEILVFVLFANIFFFHSFGPVALILLISGIWILVSFVFGRLEWGKSSLLALVLSLLLFVGSPEKYLIISTVSVAIVLTYVYTWLKKDEIGGILELMLSGLIVVREYLSSQWQIMSATLSGTLRKLIQLDQLPKERSPWIRSIFVGLLTGLPIVAWLISTLTKADPVFAQFVKEIFSEKFLIQLPSRFVFSVLLLLFLIPVLIMRVRPYVSPVGWLTRMKWGREMVIVTAMVAMVLGVFLVVQWPYVFANVVLETDLSKYGVATYSEYVQKGFADLIKVVVMVFGVAWIGLLINKNQKGKEHDLLIWIQGILGIEFVVFVISIFRRVWLYQSYHGLSLARLYGLVLLLGIVGMTVTMALRYFYQNVRWVKIEAAWILVVVLGSILINMEGLVVKNPPTVNDRVDYVYLSRLSSDGKDGWLQSYEWARQVLEKNSTNTNLIGKDDRRDIFYAGLITRELIGKYHRVILQYGTDAELREYFGEVIKTSIEIAETSRGDGSFTEELGKLRQIAPKLNEDDRLEKIDITPVARWDYGFPNYKAYQDDNYFYIQEFKEPERLTGLDYFLAYDPSEKQVYKWMKQELGYDKLLTLQKLDFDLQKRITGQPDNERDFDIDISLDSPFLR